MEHDALAASLAGHLRTDHRMVWQDIQLGPAGSPRPDVYSMMKSFIHPNPVAYECKVSVSDFRADTTSGKWQKYLHFAGSVFFAVPKDLPIKVTDVPDRCGLMVLHPSGAWRIAKRAVPGTVTIPPGAWLKLLIDGVEREGPIIRARRYTSLVVDKSIRDKLGSRVADCIRDIEQAEYQLDYRKKQAERIIAEAEARATAIRDSFQYDERRSEICAILGIPPTAGRIEMENAVRRLRNDAEQHPAERQLCELTSAIKRALENFGYVEA